MKTLIAIAFVLSVFIPALLKGQVRQTVTRPAQVQKPSTTLKNKALERTVAQDEIGKTGMIRALNGLDVSQQTVTQQVEGINRMEEELKKAKNNYIYGDKQARNYVIRYSSAPVKALYDEMVTPLVANSGFILLHHTFNEMIVSQLVQGAVDSGIYTSPGATDKLAAAIRKAMDKIDIQNPAATQSNTAFVKNGYFNQSLSEVLSATENLLSKKPDPGKTNNGSLPDLIKSTFFTEYQRAVMFFKDDAAAICIKTAQAAKWKTANPFFLDQYGKILQKAVKGELFKPLRSYHGQSSEYEIFSIRMPNLQKRTQSGLLGSLWDPECNCPSEFTFSVFQANKIKNAVVFNP